MFLSRLCESYTIKLIIFCRFGFVTQANTKVFSFAPRPNLLKNNCVFICALIFKSCLVYSENYKLSLSFFLVIR